MAKPKQYLYAVQRASGHEVVSVTVDGAKPPVEAQHLDSGLVRLVRDGEVIATGDQFLEDPDFDRLIHPSLPLPAARGRARSARAT